MREEERILEYLNGKEEDKNTGGDWIVIKCWRYFVDVVSKDGGWEIESLFIM